MTARCCVAAGVLHILKERDLPEIYTDPNYSHKVNKREVLDNRDKLVPVIC